MNKNIITLLTIISLFFIGCTNTNFSEDLKNFETCSERVEPIGDCIENKFGYQFDTATQTCSEIIVQGCAVQTPFESIEECQAACFSSEKDKERSIKKKLEEKIQERENKNNS